MPRSTDKIIINVISNYINKNVDYFQSFFGQNIMMAEEGGDDVNIDREWAEGTLDEASRYAAEIVEQFSDLGPTSKDVCDEGNTLFSLFL